MTQRASGAVLIPTLLMGLVLMAFGVGLSRHVILLSSVTSGILNQEKAYYAAESGVEMGALFLRNEAVQDLDSYKIDLGGGVIDMLTLDNIAYREEIKLMPGESVKMRYRRDDHPGIQTHLSALSDLSLALSSEGGGGQLEWKLVCRDKDSLFLQGRLRAAALDSFLALQGLDDDGQRQTVKNFLAPLEASVLRQCFYSFYNPGIEEVALNLEAASGFSPSLLAFDSLGKAHGKVKRLAFDFRQKNLSTLFDFVFLHQGRE